MLPSIYIALVDRKWSNITKMISKIDIRNKEDNLIVNKNLGSNMQIMITYLYILDFNKSFISVWRLELQG